MINHSNEWKFVRKPSRPSLDEQEINYWKSTLKKLLKVGIEVEYNLQESAGSCDRQNFLCPCKATFTTDKPMPGTKLCYEQCSKWDDGACVIAKEHGCVGIYCREFHSPCASCPKYDRGCSGCPELYDIRKDPRYIRGNIGKVLKPTRFVGEHGKSGTYKVCRDGSLAGDGGIEIATVGRRVQFASLYDMVARIIGLCAESGGYTDERCSIHIHLLASYLTPAFSNKDNGHKYLQSDITELERPMPEIILANFHQLIRRYHCALIWLSAAGIKRSQLTRWEKFRKSILPYSAIRHKMPLVTQEVGSASKSKRKYAMMNYEQIQFDKEGRVSRFHVEGRYMDGNMSPATIVAHACLLYGLVLKAVEISRYGVLEAGGKEYMDQQKEIYSHLCNHDGPWDGSRHSDTSGLDPYIPELIKQSRQVVRLVKGTLSELAPADEILRSLAEKPLALRLIEGQSWKQIEDSLYSVSTGPDLLAQEVAKLVGLGAIMECDDTEEWVDTVAHQLANDRGVATDENSVTNLKEAVQAYIECQQQEQHMRWSTEVGGYVNSY